MGRGGGGGHGLQDCLNNEARCQRIKINQEVKDFRFYKFINPLHSH